MTTSKGILSVDELKSLVQVEEIETVLVVFTDLYGRFVGKRYDAEFFLDAIAEHGSHACDYLLTVDMEMEPVQGYSFANWNLGYGDVTLSPDMNTLRIASWLNKTAMVLCDIHDNKTGNFVSIAPRSLLIEQIEKAREMGYTAKAGSEIEYYMFNDTYRDAAEDKYQNLEPAGWYIEDYHALQGSRVEFFNAEVRRNLKKSGIPVEGSKGEWGLGQQELNIQHSDILTMADSHAIYKHCMKDIADNLGISVTFMAKFDEKQAGSSCHIHLSLWRQDKNVFPGSIQAGPVKGSNIFFWFLGGWMARMPELMVFYAPTVNSYKRYQSGSWAPTRLAWSYDNRTAGFRIVGRENSLRIECRVPGADCNPYLAYAATMASGLDGIANKIEPPPIFSGDAYTEKQLVQLPLTLRDATDQFEKSDFAMKAFGKEVVEHYTHFFRVEQKAFDSTVTDWEKNRYFERI
ncbi:MAG: glutamine synthetase [Deltaproteobacteria bacterium]|nr:glutamine synthetase [Deltaproteobacteria bacterium]MBW1847439.1 glutamine synthetase [Deltaproteobacteria bacterium]